MRKFFKDRFAFIVLTIHLSGCLVATPIQLTTVPAGETSLPGTTLAPEKTLPQETVSPTRVETPALTAGTQGSGSPVTAIETARQDLARRLILAVESVQLVEVVDDEFPAGDLGCPSPDVTSLPMPAFVTGKTIILEAQGEHYIYHAHREQIVFCGKT